MQEKIQSARAQVEALQASPMWPAVPALLALVEALAPAEGSPE